MDIEECGYLGIENIFLLKCIKIEIWGRTDRGGYRSPSAGTSGLKTKACVFLCAMSPVIGYKVDIKLHYIELN